MRLTIIKYLICANDRPSALFVESAPFIHSLVHISGNEKKQRENVKNKKSYISSVYSR